MNFHKHQTLAALLLILALGLTACAAPQEAEEPVEPAEVEEVAEPAAEEEAEPEVEPEEVVNAVVVEDQELGSGNTVTIASVSSITPGWLVIHADAGGSPGAVIGHAPVAAGNNTNVVVEMDPTQATATLYAMLHVDAGVEGEYEFPEDDGPATDSEGNVVTPSFELLEVIDY